ncbi:MAG: hypothetical protein ACI9GZ_002082 [Bacteroidia bacterium]|jgi:hypothetical protein
MLFHSLRLEFIQKIKVIKKTHRNKVAFMFSFSIFATQLRLCIMKLRIMKSFFTLSLDSLGTCTSALCGLHCLLTPLLVLVLPTFVTSILYNQSFGLWIIGCSILVTGVSLIRSFIQVHKNGHPLVWGVIGVSLLLASRFAHIELLEVSLSVFGGGFIAVAHIKNSILCNRCLKIREKQSTC